MTRVEITIQDGKVTWIDFEGDELPQALKDKIIIGIVKAFD